MDFDPKLMATIGTSFITSLAAKGITGPAETINDLWKASFGYPIHYFSEKRKIKYEINLKKFEKELTEKILEIPKENIQEPKESIIGPALEASKYYFDEKEIRDMFANLIASSMDSTCNGLVQHSFTEIIKQLSPHDAKLFSFLLNFTPFVTLIAQDEVNTTFNVLVETCFFCEGFPNVDLNEITLTNLARLGLIQLTKNVSSPSMFYSKYKSEEFLSKFPKILNKKIICEEHVIQITALGKAFKKVCIKDSL